MLCRPKMIGRRKWDPPPLKKKGSGIIRFSQYYKLPLNYFFLPWKSYNALKLKYRILHPSPPTLHMHEKLWARGKNRWNKTFAHFEVLPVGHHPWPCTPGPGSHTELGGRHLKTTETWCHCRSQQNDRYLVQWRHSHNRLMIPVIKWFQFMLRYVFNTLANCLTVSNRPVSDKEMSSSLESNFRTF